jgi:hypothetical protein
MRFKSPYAGISSLFSRVSCICIGIVAFNVAHAEDAGKSKTQLVTYEQGMIFYNGEYLSLPYRIQTTADSISINGIKLPSSITVSSSEEREPRGRRHATEREQRRNSNANRIAPTTSKLARSIEESLDNEEVIVLFDNDPFHSFSTASQQYDFFKALLGSSQDETDLLFLEDVKSNEDSIAKWRNWIAGYSPPLILETEMKDFIKMLDEIEIHAHKKFAASARLETLAYPLTLAGMLLSVIAFGQLLQWIGKGFAKQEEPKPESERYLVMALVLMLGMSLIDLAWTILAGQAGVMREVNPVAGMYMNSPQQLAVFKVIATLIGFSILYIWRQRPVMQQATWWMCLVCVLVTFRWVIFNSMMS